MGIFNKSKQEVPMKIEIDYQKINQRQDMIKDLKIQIRDLSNENDRLKNEIGRLTEQLEGMKVSMSIEDVINGFKEEKNEKPFNPFEGWSFLNKPSGNVTDADGLSDNMLVPNTIPEGMDVENILDETSEEYSEIDDIR